jgi:tetratricopeptide (TPR) repeat protein
MKATPLSAMVIAVLALLFIPRAGRAATCPSSTYTARTTERQDRLLEAGDLASNGHWADARAVYLDLLAERSDDAEALFGLARVDAWEGCWELAKEEYREILRVHPDDADGRGGIVDLLIWEGHYEEAQRVLEEGLKRAPHSPPLLVRAARLAYWRGDTIRAVHLADAAEEGAVDDEDLRRARDRMFRGEARLTSRLDHYPPGYQDVYTLTGQVLQRVGRFELYGGAQLVQRFGADPAEPISDVRYPLGAIFHPSLGSSVGVELTPGAPADAIPDFATKVWGLLPLTAKIGAYLAYSFWHFAAGQTVHIINPAIGVLLPHEFRLEARAWLSTLHIPDGDTEFGGAAGLALTWRARPPLDLGVAYTYGTEFERATPVLFQLVGFRSHVMSAHADWLITRHWGVRPLLGLEFRSTTDSAPVPRDLIVTSFELGGYYRW